MNVLTRLLRSTYYLTRRLIKQVYVFICVCALCSPLVGSRLPSVLEQIQQSGKLVIASRNGPTTYYEGAEGPSGFEYVLARDFARSIGVELEIKEVEDLGNMIDTVKARKTHFAAAGLSITPRRQQKVTFTRPYKEVTQELIYRSNSPKPSSIEDLIGKQVVVIGNSSHAERLRELKKQHPDLTWEEHHDIEMLDLMEMVHNDKIDHAIVDSNALTMNGAVYPRAISAFSLSEKENLAWAFPISNDDSLINAANEFLEYVADSGQLAEYNETFYGHAGEMNYSGALLFTKRLNKRLPKWEDSLKAAAKDVDLDWHLLAALSYQESHWNPRAKSPTGVRGFMMLTLNTAKEMKVTNRLDAEQSIQGGAKYFRKQYDRLPDRITGEDRTWLALAAYNIGYNHVQDARKITQDHGGNPDKWSDIKEYLPLLAKRKYYKFTKYGYARGWEAVDYVQNIRNFYAIISWKALEQDRLNQVALSGESAQQPTAEYNPNIASALEELRL